MSGYPEIMQQAYEVQAAAIKRARNEVDTMKNSPETSEGAGGLYPGGVEYCFADIPSLYQPFSQLPDPAAYASTITALQGAMDWIRLDGDSTYLIDKTDGQGLARPEIAKLGSEGDLMPGWNGSAALAFKGCFLNKFPTFTENQFRLIAALKSAAEAHQQLWRSARKDIASIASVHLKALEHSGCDQNSWTLAFTILSGIATLPVLSEVLSATAVSVIGSVSSMAATYVPLATASDETTAHSGDSAGEIVGQMKTAIDGAHQRIAKAQSAIIDSLQSTIKVVLDPTVKKAFLEAPRPQLANMSTSQAKAKDALGPPGQA